MASNKKISEQGNDKNSYHNPTQEELNLSELNFPATVNPATTMSATVILFIIAGVALLLFTKFEYSQNVFYHYSEREDFSLVIPSSVNQRIAEATTTLASKPDHSQYLQPLYKLLKDDPTNEKLHYYIGVCYFEMEDHTNAVRNFRKVLRYPNSVWKQKAEYRLGLALWQAEKITEARTIFAKIARQPRHPYREQAASILKESDFS
jgi:TolA-binding protein